MNRLLITLGASLIFLGLAWSWVKRLPLFRLPGIAGRQQQRIGSETGRQELWHFGVMGALRPMIWRNRAAGLGGCALRDQRRDRR